MPCRLGECSRRPNAVRGYLDRILHRVAVGGLVAAIKGRAKLREIESADVRCVQLDREGVLLPVVAHVHGRKQLAMVSLDAVSLESGVRLTLELSEEGTHLGRIEFGDVAHGGSSEVVDEVEVEHPPGRERRG